MIYQRNCRITKVERIMNTITHLFGPKAMCRCKRLFSAVRGRKYKKGRMKQLQQWAAQHPEIPDSQQWLKRFVRLVKETNDQLQIDHIEEFYTCGLQLVKEMERKQDGGEPAILCVERNEMRRMPEFLRHYRKLGVKAFLITDNGSTDGTYEYLMEQPDVRLYRTDRIYNSQRKTGWQNRMVADYGLSKWYLQVDADEFAWYPEAVSMSLPDYVAALAGKKIYAAKAIMLEMYPRGIIGDDAVSAENFQQEYCYFDGDNDNYEYDPDTRRFCGGFLKRVLGEEYALQCKTPLFFCDRGGYRMVIGSHHIFPLYDDIIADYRLILRHYKFLPGDGDKIREAIKRGNYANGSRLYKKFIRFFEEEGGISAFYEGSVQWDDEKSTDEFELIKRLE